MCAECIKEIYSRHSKPEAACTKCGTKLDYGDLYFACGEDWMRRMCQEYVSRSLAEIRATISAEMTAEAQRRAARTPLMREIANTIAAKVTREFYISATNQAKSRVFEDSPMGRLGRLLLSLTLSQTKEAFLSHLASLDELMGTGLVAVAQEWPWAEPPRVEFMCPYQGCLDAVLSTPSPSAPRPSAASLPLVARCTSGHQVCRECRGIYSGQHQCLEANLETARLLRETTKACPKCFCQVEKSEGCEVMYCTKCGTAFNWNTLDIITSNIHNPHAFDSPVERWELSDLEKEDIHARIAAGTVSQDALFILGVMGEASKFISGPREKLPRAVAFLKAVRKVPGLSPSVEKDISDTLKQEFQGRLGESLVRKTLLVLREVLFEALDGRQVDDTAMESASLIIPTLHVLRETFA